MVTQVETRSPGEETSGVPIAVSTATANSATLPVKKEKPDSPPPQREVAPIRRPSPLPFLGYLSQNQAYINVRTTRKLIARPQCSICSKTFSRSGTLKVILFKLLQFAVRNLTCLELVKCLVGKKPLITDNPSYFEAERSLLEAFRK